MRPTLLTALPSSVCAQCRHRFTLPQVPRFFSISLPNKNDNGPSTPNKIDSLLNFTRPPQRPQRVHQPAGRPAASAAIDRMLQSGMGLTGNFPDLSDGLQELEETSNRETEEHMQDQVAEPHHIHVYATKHNTHITLTRQNHSPIFSFSCGNKAVGGFKKAKRGEFDAAYKLAAYVMDYIHRQAIDRDIKKLEVIYRGFAPGREAFTKALLGSEGRWLKPLVVRVSDATRLKFGGVRSRKVRRIG